MPISSLAQSMDAIKAPLNPCSLETIQEPLKVDESHSVWPLALSCYQLDESVGYRRGQLNLYQVAVPDITSDKAELPLKFGDPEIILEPSKTSGILDGKWSTKLRGDDYFFATAHASGAINLHRLRRELDDETSSNANTKYRYVLDSAAQSVLPAEERGIRPLCLSLNWASKAPPSSEDMDPSTASFPIVSTYSNGKVAVHDVVFLDSGGVSIVERDSWEAHNMFTNPAEVWSADFCGGRDKLIISCGDEGKVKLWDVRSTNRPMHVMSHFDAGATCASTHPRHEHLVAVGSYDETICLYDIRFLSTKSFVTKSRELGGGVWRIKWHPLIDNRMLVAAMHGGCRVLEVENWEDLETPYNSDYPGEGGGEPQLAFRVTNKFTEHESMAYGADWLICNHPTRNGFFEAAASCSFYDRAVFLWDTLP